MPGEPGPPVRGRVRVVRFHKSARVVTAAGTSSPGSGSGAEPSTTARIRSTALDQGGTAEMAVVVELVVDQEEPDEPVGHQIEMFLVGRRVDHADERPEVGLFLSVPRGLAMDQTRPLVQSSRWSRVCATCGLVRCGNGQ
ncbi:hypothetical protein SBADM41S_07016 [Streptomyces badius]